MTLTARDLTDVELGEWLAQQRQDYIDERVAAGELPEEAATVADAQYATLLPGGRPGPGHRILRLLEGASEVGWLWIGPRNPLHQEAWWVWDVVVDEPFRRKGYGRQAMELAERLAAEAGATDLGLNVFGRNTVARNLYESMSYETMSLQMRKLLPAAYGSASPRGDDAPGS